MYFSSLYRIDAGGKPNRESSASFEKKAQFFREMFNGDIASQKPVHVCSHQGLPCEQRHCCDRDVAVEKCTDALLDLLMSSMPGIPTPNKWTTIFGPLEFVLAGFILYGWLRQVFEIAFQGMTFSEFDETKETTDPKLIEALCFHAVNGKQHGNSLKFLQSADASWAIGLLAITLEPNRVLTHVALVVVFG